MKLIYLVAAIGTIWTAGPTNRVSIRDGEFASMPRAAWADADPADSLYRAARRALSQEDFENAARLFDSILSRYPRSEYAPDALYWKGFSLYRNGDLDKAAAALEEQAKRFSSAATRGDAAALLIRVKGELAKRGDVEAQRDVNRAATGTGRACQDMEVQSAALDALQQMDSERVLPLLRKVLARRDDCSTPLRKNALFILSQKSGADREKLLLEVAKTDPSTAVRQDAVFHLSQAKSDLAVDALEDLLLRGDERGVRSNALFALAQHRSERARKILRDFALSSDAPIALRNDAIFHLAQRSQDEDMEWLRNAYARIPEPQLRADIMFHVAQRPGPETNKWLAGIVVDSKEPLEQRKNALFHLAQRKSGGLEELIAVYDRVPVAMRKDILFHIAQRREPAALDKLMSIAKTDPVPELRKDALFYVGQSKDPRALKALEEIVAP